MKLWKITSKVKDDYIALAIETTYEEEKRRTISQINLPKEALPDFIDVCKELLWNESRNMGVDTTDTIEWTFVPMPKYDE